MLVVTGTNSTLLKTVVLTTEKVPEKAAKNVRYIQKGDNGRGETGRPQELETTGLRQEAGQKKIRIKRTR